MTIYFECSTNFSGKNEGKKFYPYTFAFFPKAPIV